MKKELCSAEVDLVFNRQWAFFVRRNPKAAASCPKTDSAKSNWLISYSDSHCDGQNLFPFHEKSHLNFTPELRTQFNLPTIQQLDEKRKKLTYPRLPTMTEMWVKNPVRGEGFSKGQKKYDEWECARLP